MLRTEVAVVGGGAAGMIAASFAARRGVRVLLLEGSGACGRKILASGGGRCNVLPAEEARVTDFHTQGSRNVLKRLLRTWTCAAQRRFFEDEIGIPLTEEANGKLFPVSGKAREVRDALREAVTESGAEILPQWKVEEILGDGGGFLLRGNGDRELWAAKTILATGGRSAAATGSDGHGYQLAAALGHRLLPRYPALVPLTTADRGLSALAGVAVPIAWKALVGGRIRARGQGRLLFTHRGFSGPAILDASHWWTREGAELRIAWGASTSEEWTTRLLAQPRRELRKSLADRLPRRLAETLLARCRLRPDTHCGNLDRRARTRLLTTLCDDPLPVKGSEGFRVAEVTGGGVPLDEVVPSTLASRRHPGLYLCGEILDPIGRIGGYNFLWAWLTGRLAGESAAAALQASAASK